MSEIFDNIGDEKHYDRLRFLMKFFTIDLILVEVPEENSSLFVFLSDSIEYERKVYDCGENFMVKIK